VQFAGTHVVFWRSIPVQLKRRKKRMIAAVYHGPLDVRIEEVPEPGPPGPDEVLVARSWVRCAAPM
jgi:hypothetical protein